MLYIIRFCTIPSLFSHQYQMTYLECLLMVTLKNIFYWGCYCRYLSENSTTVLQVHHNRVVWKRQYTKKKLYSVILHCEPFFQPNLRIFGMPQGYVWVWVLYIFQNYALLLVKIVWLTPQKNLIPNPQRSQHKVWQNKSYFKPTRILWYHMVIICTKQQHTLPW